MSADAVKNFCKVEVLGYYGKTETSIILKTGEGAKLPSPPFNLVWWNATDYQDPTDDPYREIVRVISINGDIITVLRGQEDTSPQPHNISGKVYKMMRAITAKDYNDLQNIDVYKDGVLIASRPKIDFRGVEVSDDSLNNKVNVFLTGNFAVRATNPPSLQLYVSKGQVNIGGAYVFFSGGYSPSFTIPANYPRIDLLCLNSSGNLEIVQGTESATPTAPSYPYGKFVICEVYNRPNQTCIKDSDDGTNGYIYRDVRAFNYRVFFSKTIPSETLQHANDAEVSTVSTNMVKLKEIKVNNGYLEKIRIKFDMCIESSSYVAYGQIYKNGTPIGNLWSTTSTSYVTFVEDLGPFQAGDLIQLYGRSNYTYRSAYFRNFRIYFDEVFLSSGFINLL